MLHYTPNGLSIKQLKKDAKQIKKESDITLSLSNIQNQLANKYTNFSTWHELMDTCKQEGSVMSLLSFLDIDENKQKLVTYKNKPLNLIAGGVGLGQAQIVYQILSYSYNNKCKVLFDTDIGSGEDFDYMKNLYGNNMSTLVKTISHENREEDSINHLNKVLKHINSSYNILVIFDFYFYKLSNNDLMNKIIKKCSELNVTILLMSHTPYCIDNFIESASNVLYLDGTNSRIKHPKCFDSYKYTREMLTGLYRNGVRDVLFFNNIDKTFKETSVSININGVVFFQDT
jgi:hypothetical protein